MLGMVLAGGQLLAAWAYEHPRFRSPFVGIAPAAVLDASHWHGRYARLLLARQLQPWEAAHHLELGNLHAWQALRHPPASEAGTEHYRRAAAHYRDALSLRPGWALGWSFLAEAQLGELGTGPEFEKLLKRANTLGPWEQDVQRRTALLGMALWDSLSVEAQAWVRRAIVRLSSSTNDSASLVQMAERFDRQNLLPAEIRVSSN